MLIASGYLLSYWEILRRRKIGGTKKRGTKGEVADVSLDEGQFSKPAKVLVEIEEDGEETKTCKEVHGFLWGRLEKV